MSKKNIEKAFRLLVVAHPDDETLFFSGAILQQSKIPWVVVCVTNGNADGSGRARALQFKQACKKLNVKYCIQWDLPDIFEKRLDINSLIEHLRRLPLPIEVYTHGIVGEYGHPHHQDVSYAVHQYYSQMSVKKITVWAPAYNCLAEKVFKLTASQYLIKSKIYSEIYKGETLRFSEFIPNRTTDEFTQLKWKEVEEIYMALAQKRELKKNKLDKYKWFHSFLLNKSKAKPVRPF